VQLAQVLGEPAGQLFADEHVVARGDALRALDRVVVGDRDEVHPAALGLGVNFVGGAVALGQEIALSTTSAARFGGFAVAVQVGARHRRVQCIVAMRWDCATDKSGVGAADEGVQRAAGGAGIDGDLGGAQPVGEVARLSATTSAAPR
jgi:hypothetical protein